MRRARDGRHTCVVPAVHEVFLHQFFQIALAHHGIGDVQPRKFDLAGLGGESEVNAHPVVQRAVVFEFEGTERMRDALQIVADGVREVVHGIDAPRIARAVRRARAGCGR